MYIGEKEAKWLLVILMTSRIFVQGASGFTSAAGTAAAIVALLCSLAVFLYFLVVDKIKYSEDIGIFDMMQESYGRIATVIIGIVLTALSALNCSMRLRMFSNAVSDIILPDSPVVYCTLFFVGSMIAAAYFGPEAITRYSLPVGAVTVLLTVIIAVFNIDGYKASNIYPLLGRGSEGLARSTGMVSMFSDLFYVYLLSDFFRKKHAARRVGLKAVALSGIIITSVTLLYILAVPYPASTGFDYPFFRLASLANASVLFQRIDAAVYVIWLFSGFICTGALALMTMIIFCRTFETEDYHGVMPLIIFLITVFSFVRKDFSDAVNSLFSTVVFSLTAVTAIVYRFKIISGRKIDE